MNDQGLLYIFIEPDTTTNAYYKDDGIIIIQDKVNETRGEWECIAQ